ncbi:MAG: MFS transporter [Haloferula sp.]
MRRLQFGRYDYAAFLTFFAYAAGSVVVPVCLVELAHTLGFSLAEGGMTEGGALHMGRTVAMVAAMLLVGFVAGRWGTRLTLGHSVLLMSVGVLLCAIAPTYGVLFLALMLAGLGEGVIEGLATPFVKDLHPEESGRYINTTHAFWSVGVLVTVLLSGILLSVGISWRLLVGAAAVLGFIAASMILFPSRHPIPALDHHTRLHWKTVYTNERAILTTRKFWIYYAAMFLAGGGEFCLTFWSASHIQLQFGGLPWTGGLGVAIFALAMIIGRSLAGSFVPQEKLGSLVAIAAVAGSAITACLPSASGLWTFYLLLFGAGLATAPFWPSIQSYATDRLDGLDHTMLLILLSCAGVPGCGAFTYLMGFLGNQTGSLSEAFYLVPAAYLVIGLLIGREHFRRSD